MAIRGKQLADSTVPAGKCDTTNGAISTVNAGDAAVEGSGTGVSRRDHQHAVATGASTSTIEPDDSADEGASSSLAREDHQHAVVAAAPAQGIGAGNAEGSAASFARSDHDHTIRESGAQDLTVGAVADASVLTRSGTTIAGVTAVSDSQHGDRGGSSLHSAATISVNGFMSSTDKTKLESLQDAAGIDGKESCYVRAQGDLTLSGEQTIDGSLTSVDRVLVDSQATAAEDGIYITGSGAWARAADAPAGAEARGWRVAIEQGAADGDKLFMCTNNAGSDVVGTDGLTFAQIGSGSPRGAGTGLNLNGNDIEVVPADGSITTTATTFGVGTLQTDGQHGNLGGGALHADAVAAGADGFMTGADKTKIDGVDTGATATTPQQERVTTENISASDTALADTLDNTPFSNASVVLFFNGVQMIQGATEDYTISGVTITWLQSSGTAPVMDTTDDLVAYYMS